VEEYGYTLVPQELVLGNPGSDEGGVSGVEEHLWEPDRDGGAEVYDVYKELSYPEAQARQEAQLNYRLFGFRVAVKQREDLRELLYPGGEDGDEDEVAYVFQDSDRDVVPRQRTRSRKTEMATLTMSPCTMNDVISKAPGWWSGTVVDSFSMLTLGIHF
jgi:hypothetical protein